MAARVPPMCRPGGQRELLVLGKEEFQRCMRDNFQVALKLMQVLVRRLREADPQDRKSGFARRLWARCRLLLEMSELDEASGSSSARFPNGTWRMISASREMVSKGGAGSPGERYITYENDRIVITGE